MADLPALLDRPGLAADLERVEEALRAAVQAPDPSLTGIASHLVEAGGKRIRPALAALSAEAGGASVTDEVILGGVSVELVHLGSLYHDDVIDEAPTRRGVESVNARWGNLVAILAGDFLLARASEIAAGLGTEVAALLARTIGRLCEGEVAEIQTTFNVERSEAQYYAAIEGKTASLFSSACRIGALTAGLERSTVDVLTDYGLAVGMVFQIVDDILDVVGTEAELGKPAGHDLVEGVYTLPVIRTMTKGDRGDELRGLLGRPLDEPERDKARSIVRESGTVGEACAVAREYADRAAKAAAAIGDGGSPLAELGHKLIDRLPAI